MPNINGNNSANNLSGTANNDSINAKGGSDTVNGGLGNDTLDGGSGVDTLSYDGNQSHNTINLTTGVAQSQWLAASVGVDTLLNFENVIGGAYIDVVTGNAGANMISLGVGSDSVYATLGQDTLDGGAGFDAVRFDGAAQGVTASLATGTYALDNANGGTMTGFEFLQGSAHADTLSGDANYNRLSGGLGADRLAGGGGNDQMWGGGGGDRLIADGGNDELTGDYDYWDGYADDAADVFEIRTNAGVVTVNDFELGVDKLDLTAFGFDQNGVSAYWTGSVAQQTNVQVLTLTGLANEVVTIRLPGVAAGEALALSDMIGGSSSLIPASPYPINGGNGVADVFVFAPIQGGGAITLNGNVIASGASMVLNGFENGLDRMDVSIVNSGWDANLTTAPDGSIRYGFFDGQGGSFSVLVQGFTTAQVDSSDFIF